MITAQLREFRAHELQRALPYMPPAARVLDLGAGAGWQASELQRLGYTVSAIDVPSSQYRGDSAFPVQEYDGVHIPFGDETFDVVFSSNVLEHVAGLDSLLREIRRVLRPNGSLIVVLPSTAWRFWTTLAHYPHVVRQGVNRLRRRGPGEPSEVSSESSSHRRQQPLLLRYLAAYAWPHRHGVKGNVLTELFFFSDRYWRRQFARASLRLVAAESTGLFYTGASLLDAHLSLPWRARLAPWLGTACRMYVLRRAV